jgi:2'-5' RNA ligase
VEVGTTVERALLALADTLRDRVVRLAPRARVSWVGEGRVHLTLAFIGEVDEGRAADVLGALRPALSGSPFEVSVHGVSVFPARGSPRVLWVGVGDGRDRLLQLERDVRGRLQAVGVVSEDRAYHPHLTLARVREAGGLRVARLLEGIGDARVGTFRVDAITLFQSRLSPRGPSHVALQRTALGAGGAGEPLRHE